ncbi:lytic transglycosylase domain-containing protein [Paracoccus hibiscisoli]|uniref:Lytic transglycosylase domain-containing protein n=1 Tax=Paracoccus hibiscisoli TaxID=2023261 RepID=A0A4V5MTN3_9RHOB|nr:lytic transglycosylase domain-containing protein [Paracoccus hibiscisoli]TJZ84898.1 lytic transglycosylase domain-containing protein [Paracoccus hibiscisoli]
MRLLRDMLIAGLLALPLAAPAQAEEPGAMALALAATEARDWVTARDAARLAGPLAEALVGWHALRAGYGEFSDYAAFLRNHPDWPGLDLLIQRGEAKLRPGADPDDIRLWFDTRTPTTRAGLNALTAILPEAEAADARAAFFVRQPLPEADETALLAAYPALEALVPARVTAMLDAREWAQAERLLPRLTEADRALPRARIALQAGREGVDDLILALPDDQRADPGLTLDRFDWRVGARAHDGAQALLLEASTSAEGLRDPGRWASMRVDYARLAMRNGDWDRALRLATPHFLTPENRHYADLEWLAGYAALKTGDPARALTHFDHLETVVSAAISTSRALYWQGRAHDALGDADAAQAAWQAAADLPGTYYGQLAMEKVGRPLPEDYAVADRAIDTLPDWRGSALREEGLFRAALWMVASGRRDDAQRFLLHLAQRSTPEDIARMSRLMYEAGTPWHGLRLAKQSANQGVIWPVAHFPLTGLEREDLGPPPELVMAIARQESEFNHLASSPVGAQGLMQVMPGTAEQVTRQIGLPYDLGRLSSDAAYNARIGSQYLIDLADRFGPSVALIAAGYNAGPGRSARWLGDFGDLRRDADPVDWVELIPFDETRNYVMRVAEALPVYRARIHGKPAPVVTRWDLAGGGQVPPPPQRLTLALSARPVAKPFIGPRLPDSWFTQTAAAVATE